MSDKQKIPQFWDKGIMLVDGCTRVSPGCKNCWSEKMTARFNRVPEVLTSGGYWNGNVQFNLHLLEKAAKARKPQVFAIWNDLYHPGVNGKDIVSAYFEMIVASHHTFLIVTKRPERAALLLSPDNYDGVKPFGEMGNIWHIVTAENQDMADKRIPHLLRIPGKRGIIIEPCLGHVEMDGYLKIHKHWNANHPEKLSEPPWHPPYPGYWYKKQALVHVDWELPIHQVILGPENGPGKRPFDPAWAESVKAQCKAAGVPFYRKDKAEGTLAWRPTH